MYPRQLAVKNMLSAVDLQKYISSPHRILNYSSLAASGTLTTLLENKLNSREKQILKDTYFMAVPVATPEASNIDLL